MLRALWLYLRGYVIIRVKGPNLERFINSVVQRGGSLWRARRMGPDVLVASVTVEQFRPACRTGRQAGLSVRILAKAGLPFLMARCRRRPMWVVGAAVAVAAIYGAAGRVWFVDVEGAQSVEPRRIVEVAAEAGLRRGMAKEQLNAEAIRRHLLLRLDRLAWATVDLQGTLATIRVAEKTVGEAAPRPGHVVAALDGVVERLVVRRGEPLVAVGETVRRGQILISGLLLPGTPAYEARVAAGQPPVVAAQGEVIARVWVTGYGEARLVERVEEPTGRRAWAVEVNVFGRRWRVGPAESPYRHFRTRAGHLGNGITWRRFDELGERASVRSYTLARDMALAAAWQEVREQLATGAEVRPGSVIDCAPQTDGEVALVRCRVRLETAQPIGRFDPIAP